MPIKYFLDKIFDIGAVYRAESDKAYVFDKIATDSTTIAKVKVGGTVCGEIEDDICSMFPVGGNLLGPVELGALRIIVPPGKTLEFEGESGKRFRCVGQILELAPGEALPTELMARYAEQGKKFIDYLLAAVSRPAGTVIVKDAEITVLEFTCPPGEEWVFNRLFMAEAAHDGVVSPPHQFAFRPYVEDKALDIIEAIMGRKGLCNQSAPYPPRIAINTTPFSLKELPIKLTPGKTLKVTVINTAADFTVPTGTTWVAKVAIVGERTQLS